MDEKEDVAPRLRRSRRESRSPASLSREDLPADPPESLARAGPVAPVGDEELAGRVEAERGEFPGNVGSLVANRDDDGCERELLRASDASIAFP